MGKEKFELVKKESEKEKKNNGLDESDVKLAPLYLSVFVRLSYLCL